MLWRPHDGPPEAQIVASDGVVYYARLGQKLQQASLPAGVTCAAWSQGGECLAYAVGDKLTVCKGFPTAEADFSSIVHSEMQAS